MKTVYEKISIDSTMRFQIIEITRKVEHIVKRAKIKKGIVNIATMHTTSGIRVNESEPHLLKDVELFFKEMVPAGKGYGHDIAPVDNRKNTDAHLRSWMLGASETLPVQEGVIVKGTWQRIFFVELDGPRKQRNVNITIVGE
ncbi:MAG: secondary thiamine-phosphate synthase enzyme YjbQ [Candidatus Diapherotrites archaeon]